MTMLSKEQVLKLSPYMVDVKRVGDLITTGDTLMINDTFKIFQPRTRQSFTFRVLLDENNAPVMPDSTSTTTERRAGNWQSGGIETICLGGCTQYIGTSICDPKGCQPYDNACGCTPPICVGGCTAWNCSSEILGAISGRVRI